jgi:hypothetical protein
LPLQRPHAFPHFQTRFQVELARQIKKPTSQKAGWFQENWRCNAYLNASFRRKTSKPKKLIPSKPAVTPPSGTGILSPGTTLPFNTN